MKRTATSILFSMMFAAFTCALAGCREKHADAATEAPPPAKVVQDINVASWSVEDPSKYPLVTSEPHEAAARLMVTGTVAPDIARTVPVISLASGRVVEIRARLGDEVKKGQVLLRLRSDDISGGFANYENAVADEELAKAQWERAQDLYKHGAIALNDLQIADDAEKKAKVARDAAAEHLKLMGSTVDHPSGIVDLVAPVSGIITDQQVTNAAGVQSLGTNPFTISDLSYVWVVCDVYENDIPNVKIGDTAEVRLNAFPEMALKGMVSNILPILDPSIRTAKVRIEVRNPGMLRLGMFASATFSSLKKEKHTIVPASTILRLHDRDWVYVPAAGNKFQRIEVIAGDSLPNNMLELISGLQPGQKVVVNPLSLQNEIDNK
ncbi:efflux RND transporter periplasmic adaptor subunit [Telmatobacter sp. DSM 110680]|uniref:Efflux RND transporter periplasmic adaptor subunit n=1 Tax=Telmatobacter sp. DSM 110680 TaxID=3036704 RepID=A0AAU7DS91_9BACT